MLVDLAACQIRVSAEDYASVAGFRSLLARAGRRLDAIRSRDAAHCLAVFPEMIGAFLPLVHGGATKRTTDAALRSVALRKLPALGRAMVRGRTLSPKLAFLLAVGDEVRGIYQDAFAAFARTHGAWVVAGSALLPEAGAGARRVYNTSALFAPDGGKRGETRKVNLVPTLEDVLGLTPGAPEDVRPVQTPFGSVTTLICYDGFAVSHRRAETGFCPMVPRIAAGTDILAHPSANPWAWDETWSFGDRPAPAPRPRRDQWIDEGLATALKSADIPYAVTAHLTGSVLDNRFDGRSHIFERGQIVAEARDAQDEDVILRTVSLRHSVETSPARG